MASKNLSLLGVVAVVLASAGMAQAQTLTWSASTSTLVDGSGTWNTSQWWSGGSAGAWVTSNTAQFGSGSSGSNPYTVTLSQATTANGIIFQNQALSLIHI